VRPDRNMDMEIQIMKKQEISAQPVVGEDTTAVDTLSAELVQAVGVEADAAGQSFQDEKKLEDEVLAAKSGEQAIVASTDDGVTAMIMADTNAQSAAAGAGVGGGAAAGGLSTGMLIAGGVAGAVAIGAAVSSDSDSKGAPPNVAPETDTTTQSVAVTEDTAKTITVTATDGNGDALTYSAAGATKGTVTGGTNGQFTYTPNANANGTDSFTVTIDDGKGGTTTQLVNVTIAAVNDAPVANTVAPVTTAEDTPATINVVASDVDGDTLTYTATAQNGSVAIGANGALTYTPNANFNGTDSVVITVADGNGGTTTQTVAVTVTPVNDAPVTAATQAVTTAEDTATTVTVTGSDVDGDTLTYSAGTASDGVVTAGAASGDFVYTPNADFNGADSFVVTVADGNGGTTTQTINVSVSAVAEDYTLTVAATDSVEGNAGSNNKLNYVLTLDKAPPVDESVTITVATAPGSTNPASAGSDYVTGVVQIIFGPGETTKLFAVDINGDTAFEQDESVKLDITAPSNVTVAGDLEALILNDDSNQQNATLADDTIVGTDQDDVFTAGTVNSGGFGGAQHTLGSADSFDGKAGSDTLKISDNTFGNLVLNSVSVENIEARILGNSGTILDFSGASDVEQITNTSQAGNTFTVNSLNDDAKFVQKDGASTTNINYSQVGTQAIDNVLDIDMNNANGARFNFNNAQTVGINTLNLAVNGPAVGNAAATTTIGNGTITGVNNLTTVNLSGNANVAGAGNLAEDLTPAIFNGVTTFNASALTGNLNINLLGDALTNGAADRNITFNGAAGNNSLVIGQGNNAITMQGGNDLVVLSSVGLNANDSFVGGAGSDTLEIHFNAAASAATTLDSASDTVAQAIANTSGVEKLIVDVWNEVGENVNLNASLVTGFTTVEFDDTFTDGVVGAPAVANQPNVQDLDISGLVNVTQVSDAQNFSFVTDDVNSATFTAAAGQSVLNVSYAGKDAVEESGLDDDTFGNLAANGFSQVNLAVQNTANGTAALNPSTVNVNNVFLDDSSTLTLTGATDSIFINIEQNNGSALFNGTVDASGLTTTATTAAPNAFLFEASNVGLTMQNVTFTGTGQADQVFATAGDDVLNGGAGADLLIGNAGDDRIFGGDGNDVIAAGSDNNLAAPLAGVAEGIDYLDGGDGNDTFLFTYSNVAGQEGITSADTVIGGAGNDTVQILTPGAALNDQIFFNWNGVENLTLANGAGSQVTVNSIGLAAGLSSITGGNGFDTFNVGEGFTGPLRIDISAGGSDTLVGATAKGAITVFAQGLDIDNGDMLTAGVNVADRLILEADNSGAANLDNLTAIEFIDLVSTTVPNGADVSVIFGAGTGDAVLNSLSAGVNSLTIDASAMTNVVGNTADAIVDASTITVTAKNIVLTGGQGNDTLLTGAADDVINGGAGGDTITGGLGKDLLTGGAGADIFDYDAQAESSTGVATIDQIMDFISGTDVIDVDFATMFPPAGPGVAVPNAAGGSDGNGLNFAGNQATFGQAQGATTQNDGIIDYVFQTDTNTLWVDVNDDGTLNGNDLQISLVGVSAIAQFDVVDFAV
jgi:VCBS repeat-containing protein